MKLTHAWSTMSRARFSLHPELQQWQQGAMTQFVEGGHSMTILEQYLQNTANRKQPAVAFFDREQTIIAKYSVVAQTMETTVLEARRGKPGAHAHASSCQQLYFSTRGMPRVENIVRKLLAVQTVMVTTAIGMLSRRLGRARLSYSSTSSLYNNSPLPCTPYLRFQRPRRLATTSRLRDASDTQ